MPPKPKFTTEKIITTAFNLVRAEGMSALTARTLGLKLNSSARPIFTVFQNMEELQQEVIKAAKKLYASYIQKGLTQSIAFRGVGSQYIQFAINEPKLFQLLFMEEQAEVPTLSGVLPLIDESYDLILASIQDGFGVDEVSAQNLYQHLWIYTHGIATLCATKMCRFTEEELQRMMTDIFISLLKNAAKPQNGKNE
jgi:hypothetical protein